MIVREARAEDGPAILRLFAAAPVRAGTAFLLDRSPDFFALLRTRGRWQTFVAEDGRRLAGIATALWYDARDGQAAARVGEIVDLRVAEWARGRRASLLLLGAVSEVLRAVHVDWAVCVIADRNRAAASLVRGVAGFPTFSVLEHWASLHYLAVRSPRVPLTRRSRVREAVSGDAALLTELSIGSTQGWRLMPRELFSWPDPLGRHRAWIAENGAGQPVAGLVTWSASDLRKIRIARYAPGDSVLRLALAVAAPLGAAVALPAEGQVLKMWAARWIGALPSHEAAIADVVRAAVGAAVTEGVHVVQINVPSSRAESLRALPLLPRSTFRSTLFGVSLRGPSAERPDGRTFYADLAAV